MRPRLPGFNAERWYKTIQKRSGGELEPVDHVVGQQLLAGLRRIHDPLADQVAQGFGGAAAERAVARAAIEPRYGVFVGKAESAMELDRLAGDTVRHLVAGDFCHSRHERIGKRIGGDAGAIEDAPGDLDVAIHFRKLPADALEIADRLAEHGSVPDVIARLVEGALRQPKRN